MGYTQIMSSTFYADGLMESKYLDRFLYRGKGRPRKTDYSPLDVIQKKLNTELNQKMAKSLIEKEKEL